MPNATHAAALPGPAAFHRQALTLAHLCREAAAAPASESAAWLATLARHAQLTLEAARPAPGGRP